jgi:lipid-binding SYLF domain-containing protein
VDRLDSAAKSLQEIVAAPDKGIPDEVLSGAQCIAIVPSMLKGGFIVGAKHGRGVSTCRLPNRSWSAPAFFMISGGSWAAQIGVEDVQLVMMIMNDDGMRHLLQDKFQIGGSASAAAGIHLEGSWIESDKRHHASADGRDYTNTELLNRKVMTPAAARPFINEVRNPKRAEETEKHEKQHLRTSATAASYMQDNRGQRNV